MAGFWTTTKLWCFLGIIPKVWLFVCESRKSGCQDKKNGLAFPALPCLALPSNQEVYLVASQVHV